MATWERVKVRGVKLLEAPRVHRIDSLAILRVLQPVHPVMGRPLGEAEAERIQRKAAEARR